MTTPPTVALAVSGHGFGHAVRSAEVARALLAHGARVKVRTEAPTWLFPAASEPIPSPGWPIDVGVAQHDGLDLDVDETRRRWAEFARHFDARAQAEGALLRAHGVDVLLGDIPPLAFAAAHHARIPALAMGNFGWDWIYAVWPDFRPAIDVVQRGYRAAERLLRLPLHSAAADAFPAFRSILDVPLVARRASRSRADVRRELGLSSEARAVLLSFGGFAARGLDLAALGAWPDYVFVIVPPLATPDAHLPSNLCVLGATPSDYVSLLAACDVVVTKPGYGVAADCLANRVPMLFTERGPFREYAVFAEALPTLGRARYVPRADLLAGALGPHLDALLAQPHRWADVALDGAEHIAGTLLARADAARPRGVGPTHRPDPR